MFENWSAIKNNIGHSTAKYQKDKSLDSIKQHCFTHFGWHDLYTAIIRTNRRNLKYLFLTRIECHFDKSKQKITAPAASISSEEKCSTQKNVATVCQTHFQQAFIAQKLLPQKSARDGSSTTSNEELLRFRAVREQSRGRLNIPWN